MTDAIVIVVPGDDVLLADLLGPPAKLRHPILDRADGQALHLPALDQSIDMLRFQADDNHMSKAQFLELVGDLVEHALAVVLCRIAAVAIPITEAVSIRSSGPAYIPRQVQSLLSICCPFVPALCTAAGV